jgi:MFS family permease
VAFEWSSDGNTVTVGPLSAGPAPTDADLGFADAVDDLKKAELKGVREQASGWGKVLAGLTGLLGAGQLVAGPAFADKLAAPWSDIVGVLLVVAIVLAAVSSVAAGWAALGRPRMVSLIGSGAAGGGDALLQTLTDDLVAAARRPLIVATATAVSAFVVALVVGALLWWAPRAPAADDPGVCIEGAGGSVVGLDEVPAVTSGTLTVVACP